MTHLTDFLISSSNILSGLDCVVKHQVNVSSLGGGGSVNYLPPLSTHTMYTPLSSECTHLLHNLLCEDALQLGNVHNLVLDLPHLVRHIMQSFQQLHILLLKLTATAEDRKGHMVLNLLRAKICRNTVKNNLYKRLWLSLEIVPFLKHAKCLLEWCAHTPSASSKQSLNCENQTLKK